VTQPDAASYFRDAIDRLRVEIADLERASDASAPADRLQKAELELAIAEAELDAIERRTPPTDIEGDAY
jgi:hypothetical protein